MIRPALPLLFVAALALCACRGNPLPNQDREESDPTLVRIYAVAPEKAEEIRVALASVLSTGKDEAGRGRASLLPDGRLIVLAPLRLQASIAEALKQLDAAAGDRGPGTATTVRMNFWIVDADTGASTDDAALAPVRDALAAVKESVAASRFVLHDSLVTTTNLEGANTSATTASRTRINHQLRPARDGVRLELHIEGDGGTSFATMATIPFDQTLVLAQLNAGAPDGAPGRPHVRLYLVRAERAAKP